MLLNPLPSSPPFFSCFPPLPALCREKDIPIDMLELPNKSEKIQQLAWEPKGSRFALLHGEGNRPAGACRAACLPLPPALTA
jgi:hypothetical protein